MVMMLEEQGIHSENRIDKIDDWLAMLRLGKQNLEWLRDHSWDFMRKWKSIMMVLQKHHTLGGKLF